MKVSGIKYIINKLGNTNDFEKHHPLQECSYRREFFLKFLKCFYKYAYFYMQKNLMIRIGVKTL